MKKLIGLMLVLCLIFSFAADAFAAGRPKITKQPETATTKKGKAVFSITVTGTVDSYTWYFTDPSTDETISGQKLQKSKRFKGLKITGYNGKKMTLSKVPDAMHGWQVYCHVNGNGYKMDSDTVFLYVAGMDVPAADPDTVPVDTGKDEQPDEKEIPASSSADDDMPDEPDDDMPGDSVPGDSSESDDDIIPYTPEEDMSGEPEDIIPAEPEADDPDEPFDYAPADETDVAANVQDTPVGTDTVIGTDKVVVTANAKVLRMLDDSGSNPVGEPSSRLELKRGGSVIVQSIDSVIGWTIGDTRFEPSSSIFEFRVLNLAQDMSVDIMTQSTPDDMIETAWDDLSADLPDESKEPDIDPFIDASAEDDIDMTAPVSDAADFAAESEDSSYPSDIPLDIPSEPEENQDPVTSAETPVALTQSSDNTGLCKIVCTGCTFTYLSGGLRSVTEGEVPSGARISVIADNDSAAAVGYRINGGEAGHIGVTSFRIIVSGDMTITAGR